MICKHDIIFSVLVCNKTYLQLNERPHPPIRMLVLIWGKPGLSIIIITVKVGVNQGNCGTTSYSEFNKENFNINRYITSINKIITSNFLYTNILSS